MRVVLGANVVLCDFGARNHQHAVLAFCARGFLFYGGNVVVERLRSNGELPPAECRHPSEPTEKIFLAQDMVGDREHVKLACPAVEIHHLAKRQPAVAPRRVYMEVAQQKGLVSRHANQARTSSWVVSDGRCRKISAQKFRT